MAISNNVIVVTWLLSSVMTRLEHVDLKTAAPAPAINPHVFQHTRMADPEWDHLFPSGSSRRQQRASHHVRAVLVTISLCFDVHSVHVSLTLLHLFRPAAFILGHIHAYIQTQQLPRLAAKSTWNYTLVSMQYHATEALDCARESRFRLDSTLQQQSDLSI